MTSERGTVKSNVVKCFVALQITISPSIIAKKYAIALRNAQDVPVDVGDKIEMELPDFADHERLKRWMSMGKKNDFNGS